MTLARALYQDDEEQRRLAMAAWIEAHNQQYDIFINFIKCVKRFDIDTLQREFVGIGDIVNLPDMDNKATALHYAAGSGARKIIQWLANQPEIDHLITDRFRRLPSVMAYEVGKDAALGLYLAKKEHKQAVEQGMDIREMLVHP